MGDSGDGLPFIGSLMVRRGALGSTLAALPLCATLPALGAAHIWPLCRDQESPLLPAAQRSQPAILFCPAEPGVSRGHPL